MLTPVFSVEAAKYLEKRTAKDQKLISGKILAYCSDPQGVVVDTISGKRPWCRLRAGDYRILFYRDDGCMKIQYIELRGDAYQRLEARLPKV